MTHIVLTPEQAQVVLAAGEPVEVRDAQGRTVAHLTRLSAEDVETIEVAKRRLAAGGPRIPSERVQAFLRKLDELAETEGVDRAKVDELLRRTKAGEPL